METDTSEEARNQAHTPEEFAIVERVARIITSVYGINPDYTRLAAELEPAISFDIFGVVLLRHDRQAVRVTVCRRDDVQNVKSPNYWTAKHHQHPLNGSMLEYLLHSSSLIVKEYPNGLDGPPVESGDALSNYHQLHATCIVPLCTEERVLGTLELGSIASNTYSDPAVQGLIKAVAHVIATTIERAQLGGSAQIQDRQRQALKDVSNALASKMDISSILEHIVVGVAKALNVASAIVTYHPRTRKLQLEAQSGLNKSSLEKFVNDNLALDDQCIIGSTLRHRQSYVSADIANDERFSTGHLLATELGMRSILSHPLMTGTALYGVFLLCSPEPGGFTPLKVDILALFASQATIALHTMSLESTRQHSHLHTELEQGSQRLLSAMLHEEDDKLLTDTPSVFTQSPESALARAGILSELSALLMQIKQPANRIKDSWFVTNLIGTCIYMSPTAEDFCGIRMIDVENNHMTIEELFAGLFVRMRNAEEVRQYLQDFTQGTMSRQETRCTLALDPTYPLYTQEKGTSGFHVEGLKLTLHITPDHAPSDNHYQFTRYPLYNQQGQLTAYALQVRDVTMQVLDEKNKAALLSSVSHDLRTPLTTIKAAVTGLLQTDIPWDEQMRREMLEDIDAETDHLTTLVNALIEMSRIEMGALMLEKEWCDILEVAHSTLTKTKRILADREVHTHFQSSLPLVYADHVQLGRVFYNLIENATRHSPANTDITMIIDSVDSGQNLDPAAKALRVQIIDQGYGIPEYERERIFKSFYGLRSHGSGLGLAICKGIVEAHRGRIWVEAVAGGGSRFIFTLPCPALNITSKEGIARTEQEESDQGYEMGASKREVKKPQ